MSTLLDSRAYTKPFKVSCGYHDRVPPHAPVFVTLNPRCSRESALLADERVNPAWAASAAGLAYFYYRLRWRFLHYA